MNRESGFFVETTVISKNEYNLRRQTRRKAGVRKFKLADLIGI
jgi:hypothetical protein